MTNLEVALKYAEAGMAVFPCGPDKRPLVTDWLASASADAGTIREWWQARPDALIGLPTKPLNLLVLDADRHNPNEDGVATLRSLCPDLPAHPWCTTANNGEHHFFKQNGTKIGNKKIGGGLETRGFKIDNAGGYVIASGSQLADGRKWWRGDNSPSLIESYRDGTIPEVPAQLITIIQPPGPPPPPPAAKPRRSSNGGSREAAYARTALDNLCAELAAMLPDSGRNIALNNAALGMGHMVAAGWIERGEVEHRLTEAALACRLDRKEIAATLRSGIKTGLAKPHPPLKDRPLPPKEQKKKPQSKPESADDGATDIAPEWPDLNKRRLPAATCTNARTAIEALGIGCRYNVFHDRKLVGGYAIEQWAGELSDHACHMLRVVIKKTYGFDPGKEHTHDAAIQLCLQHQFDPINDYLDGLTWDGTKRLDKWLSAYLGAEDTELNNTIGRLALIAAVRRVRQPGCKFDQIIVLEGPEGTGKSTAIEILAGQENFSDQTIIGLDDRQQQEAVRGVWLFEIADLAGMSKADVDRTKAFASRLSDRARPAYGRQRVELPRRCVFFATTNNETYLKSQTGNRRFWPVKTSRIDLDAMRRDRDQMWAEAAHLEARGASLKLPEEMWSEAAAEQDRRRDQDPWDDILADVKGTVFDVSEASGIGQEERISTTELLTVHLKLPADRANDVATKRLSYCMARLGWSKAVFRVEGKQQRGYRRPIKECDGL
jgi:hypothetical protein